jgi:hypothetical protein
MLVFMLYTRVKKHWFMFEKSSRCHYPNQVPIHVSKFYVKYQKSCVQRDTFFIIIIYIFYYYYLHFFTVIIYIFQLECLIKQIVHNI